MTAQATRLCDFFYPPSTASNDSLAILHLKRDSLIPIILRDTADDGYAEGAVTNTRFGSFPHSTIIGAPWGSQIRASKVDTGSRGRRGKNVKGLDAQVAPSAPASKEVVNGLKRAHDTPDTSDGQISHKRQRQHDTADDVDGVQGPASRSVLEAGSGFVHILPPTPEAWTASLDHRTQVVYTPDYSYILQRLRVRPGSHIIEAGAGSGSFTHAAMRAVFNGQPGVAGRRLNNHSLSTGRVYSYEYHEPRVQTLRAELSAHGLDSMVTLTHRDVCNEGFSLAENDPAIPKSPQAEAIFLDLPAPWLALKHLTRAGTDTSPSPLAADRPVHICTFSPCIEQVMVTTSALRRYGWVEISMVEVRNRRIDVRRERIGLKEEGLRGVNATAASVDEAIGRLREDVGGGERKTQTRRERLESIKKEAASRKLYKEGRLVHRTESEVKNHTSYLVFAILPRAWTEEDERRAEDLYPFDMTSASAKGAPAKAKDDIEL